MFKGVNLEDMPYKNVHILDETLYINSVSEEQNGEYQCAGTNQAGTGYSNTLRIKVASKSTILIRNKQVNIYCNLPVCKTFSKTVL